MRQTRTMMVTHRLIGRLMLAFLLAAWMVTTSACAQTPSKLQAQTLRTVTGVVTDDHHELLRGVVVELENPANHQIVSYLTAADGRYIFKRLDGNTDFQIWATFRGHKSAVHSISMFDTHMDKVIDIVCKTY